jgi:predicted DNA-binding transcriptional regulator YafY
MQFGYEAEVLAPASLRATVAEQMKTALAAYRKDGGLSR